MPSLGVSRSHWPVVAWVRLKLPPPERPKALMGAPPPLAPPLDILIRSPVRTDPRRQVYAFEEETEEGVVRLIWDAEDPEVLEAELRAPYYGSRLPKEKVPVFFRAVKELLKPLGSLPILGADPRP